MRDFPSPRGEEQWILHDVVSGRDGAIQAAEELVKGEKAARVKVVKETYNPDSDAYLKSIAA